MRRSDREVRDFDEMVQVIQKCDVCRLALHDEEYPYILPLNFGLQIEKEQVVLYFHGALEGTKYELIKRDNRASFEMDCSHNLVIDEETENCTMEYESIIGRGHVEMLNESQKKRALMILMEHYRDKDFPINEAVMKHTAVFRLVVENMTGKVRKIQK